MVRKLFFTSQRLFGRQQSSILSAATVITASSMISALLGLLRNRLLISYFFGDYASQQALDAYWVAFRLPELVFQILVIGALSAAFIPVFSKYFKKSKDEAYTIASSVMNVVLLVFGVLAVIIFIFAEEFTQFITSDNFSSAQIALAAQLTRIMLLAQFFFAISNFLTSMIQAQQRFLIPALSPIAYNVGIILGIILLTPTFGIYGPAIGVVIGALLHLLMQIPLARKLGFVYKPVISLAHKGVKEMLGLMPPRILTISVNQVELFASVYFATALPAGSLTIINIAVQLMSAPIRIFSVPLGQASLPFLSQTVTEGHMKQFKNTLLQSLHQVLFLAFPAGMLLLILRIPLVRIAYGAAEFPWAATLLTGKVLAILAIALFAQGGIHILTRGYYALHNTKAPFLIALLAVAINIVISYMSVFVYSWGVIGLAAAMSIAAVIQFGLLLIFVLPKLEDLKTGELLVSPIKIILATAVMGIALWVPMRLLDQFVFDTTRVIPLLLLTAIASLIGGAVYLGLARFLQIPELEAFMHMFKRLGNWREVLKASDEVIEEPPTTAHDIKPLQ